MKTVMIRPMLNIDAYSNAWHDLIIGVSLIIITSFFGLACVVGIVYRFDALKQVLGV